MKTRFHISFVLAALLFLIPLTPLTSLASGSPLPVVSPSPIHVTLQDAMIQETTAASGIGMNSAILNGTANPMNTSATVFFEWGLTTAYGSTLAASPSNVTGNTPVAVSANLTGLAPGATYHFRIGATNPCGTAYGADQSFSTSVPPVPTLSQWGLIALGVLLVITATVSIQKWRVGV